MKITMRSNIFETNSSSVHTLVYRNQTLAKPELPINPETNKVIGHFGRFGKDDMYYDSQEDKLAYLLTCLYYNCGWSVGNIYDNWVFHDLEIVVDKHCGTNGIEIDYSIDPEIDHQSHPENSWSCALFEMTRGNMENFIFNPDVMLHTDCD